jgi:hypothetical protein
MVMSGGYAYTHDAQQSQVLISSRVGICVWRRSGTLRTVPVELDCVHDDHDQGHDEGNGVEVEWE